MNIACRKNLDFNSEEYFEISTLLKSANCSVPCGTVAACEGRQVMVRGEIDALNNLDVADKFFLLDTEKDKFRMEVLIDSSAAQQVFDLIQNAGGRIARVIGVLDGYDGAANVACDRKFVLFVAQAEQVSLE